MSARELPDGTSGALGRREFLKGAAGTGGALLIALTLPACAKRGTGAAGGAAGGANVSGAASRAPATLNAWLRIAPDDSITVIVDRSEMGQGVYTALPMLLAEELEVPLARVRIEAAPVGDAYVNPGNGGQVTGTSNSVQDAWEKLRSAGARARRALIAAAAQRFGVDPATCRAENGRVRDGAGRDASYGELAALAATLVSDKPVALKAPTDWKLIGQPLARTDTPAKVDGSAEFGIDVKLPGMLHATLVQSPVLGGTVESLDTAAAEKMAGVRKVFAVDGGVVIVAEHVWQALAARAALKITWNPGANARLDNVSIRALLAAAAAKDAGMEAHVTGDAPGVLAKAPHVLRASYEVPLLAHATMEPMNCTADVTAHGCDLYLGTQVQQVSQATAAKALGIPASEVRVHTTLLGGGFGRRLDVDFIPAAVLASKAVGAPVKLIWTREDDMTHDTYRPPARLELAAALGGGGAGGTALGADALAAWSLHIVSPSVTARMFPPVKGVDDSVVEYAINFPYAVPNTRLTYTRQEIGIDCGYMRSVSHAQNCFAIECFMDELAAAAGRDPLQFRLALLAAKPRHARVLKEAAERAGWGKAAPGRHLGLALLQGYDTLIGQVAEISLEPGRLKVHKLTCVVDCGMRVNPRIVESQIQGGLVFGLSAALWGDVTVTNGEVQQHNFDTYRVARIHEVPVLDVHVLESSEAPGGIGEAAVPAVAPAIVNAIAAASGRRIRRLPVAAAGGFAV